MSELKVCGDFEVKNAAKGEVEAVFATLGVVDADGDVIEAGAFSSGSPVRISAYGHESWKGSLPVGRGTIREQGGEAVLAGRFFLGTQAGRDTFEVVKELGPLQEWSFSLTDVKSRKGELGGQRVRFIESVTVEEVSPVLKGAGVRTRTLAVKSADDLPEEVMEEVLRIRNRFWLARKQEQFEELCLKHDLKEMRRGLVYSELGYSSRTILVTECGERLVAAETQKAAAAALTVCTTHLGLSSTPTLRWYEPETQREKAFRAKHGELPWESYQVPENSAGFALRDEHEVWIRRDLSLRQAMSAVAHECRHLAQDDHRDATDPLAVFAANEHDAKSYEAQFLAAFIDRRN